MERIFQCRPEYRLSRPAWAAKRTASKRTYYRMSRSRHRLAFVVQSVKPVLQLLENLKEFQAHLDVMLHVREYANEPKTHLVFCFRFSSSFCNRVYFSF